MTDKPENTNYSRLARIAFFYKSCAPPVAPIGFQLERPATSVVLAEEFSKPTLAPNSVAARFLKSIAEREEQPFTPPTIGTLDKN